MSWFDTAGFATLAKTALKEAQKTIDKALDIQDEEGQQESKKSPDSVSSGSDVNTDSFFSAWGIQSQTTSSQSSPGAVTKEVLSPHSKMTNSSSLWGSFTGSFFENQAPVEAQRRPTDLVSVQPKISGPSRSLSLDLEKKSLPAAPESEDKADDIDGEKIREEIRNFPHVEVVMRKKEPKVNANRSSSSISPMAEGEGVEVIPEDEDDVSLDDNTSASETTLTMTVLEPSNMLKSTSSLDTSFSEVMSPRETTNRSLTMVLTHTDPKKEDVITEPPKLSLGSPKVSESLSDQETIQAETSSCEGTIMGSSDEGANLKVARSSVSNLLADAMVDSKDISTCNSLESNIQNREQSPISSERSDLVKIGSSGHTSGDEIETATSSDIEIISSPTPNGSSTASRHSPTKSTYKSSTFVKVVGKVKGHHREPSETSSGGSDECSEVEKLHKRIAEMSELLEARESKLIDLSRINADLHESNSSLKSQLERQNEAQDLKSMSEEYTQRLAALERKFQQVIREKEQLRKQLDHAKSIAAEREDDMDKDQLIAELRSEGEKLSKQQLTLNDTIKKLRKTDKENAKCISTLKEQLNNTQQELDRSKKTMAAKEEMERSHIEAVHNLKKQVSQLEKELSSSKGKVENLTTTVVSLQKELKSQEEMFKKSEKSLKIERNQLEAKVKGEVNNEMEALQQQVISLQGALDDMRLQLISTQEQHSKLENNLRKELSETVRRAEAAERRSEEESEALKNASRPLAKQLQSLTDSHAAAQAQWERRETFLTSTIAELEDQISSLTLSERNVRLQYESSGSRIAELIDKISGLTQQNDSLLTELNSNRESMEKLKVLKNSELKKHQTERDRLASELDVKRKEIVSLKEVLSVERAALDAEKRKSAALQEQLRTSVSQQASPRSSPTPSRTSLSESLTSSVWHPLNEDIETASTSGRFYDVLRPSNNSTYIETLQSQLKLKEGENQQLQWDIARLDSERTALRDEIGDLSAKVETQSEELLSLESIRTQYDALLQMYGEKLEESQELKMDLQDMKEMYKAQIDHLLKKEPGPSS